MRNKRISHEHDAFPFTTRERHIYSKPDMEKYIKAISQWIDGIPYEKAFWNNVYRWKQTFNGMMQWSNYGGIIDLECFDANRFLSSCTSCKPKVLDVGCGLSYATGNYIEINGTKTELDLHYVDPLADVFNDIKKRHHRNLPDIEFGMVECLSDSFPPSRRRPDHHPKCTRPFCHAHKRHTGSLLHTKDWGHIISQPSS